eukprot:4344206-Pleurochrysis_carterae.AAC.3
MRGVAEAEPRRICLPSANDGAPMCACTRVRVYARARVPHEYAVASRFLSCSSTTTSARPMPYAERIEAYLRKPIRSAC